WDRRCRRRPAAPRAAAQESERNDRAREACQVPAEEGVEWGGGAPASAGAEGTEGAAVAFARDSPWRLFKERATSGGMYFSSCLARTSSATNVPSVRMRPWATTPAPSRKRSGSTPV